jgi:hypothetical protein
MPTSVPIEISRSDHRLSLLASGVGFDASSFTTSAMSLKPCFWLSCRLANSADASAASIAAISG